MKQSVQQFSLVGKIIVGLACLSAICYEVGLLPEGVWAGDGRLEYISLMIASVVTLSCVYVAISWRIKERRHKWGLLLLSVTLLLNVHLYYATWQSSCAVCLLLALLVFLFLCFVKPVSYQKDESEVSAE